MMYLFFIYRNSLVDLIPHEDPIMMNLFSIYRMNLIKLRLAKTVVTKPPRLSLTMKSCQVLRWQWLKLNGK